MALSDKEKIVALATILNLHPDEIVKDYLIIAHTHDDEHNECEGKIVNAGNCSPNMSVALMCITIPIMMGMPGEFHEDEHLSQQLASGIHMV